MTIPTARELYEQSNRFRDEGGPGMPECLVYKNGYSTVLSYFEDDNGRWVKSTNAAAILRDHGRTWLENQGTVSTYETAGVFACRCITYFASHENLAIEERDVGMGSGPTMLAAINAAIGAYLDAKEGK